MIKLCLSKVLQKNNLLEPVSVLKGWYLKFKKKNMNKYECRREQAVGVIRHTPTEYLLTREDKFKLIKITFLN